MHNRKVERTAVSEDSQPLSYRAAGLGRIEGQLLEWRDEVDVVDGRRLVDPYKEFPEFDLYNKVWRLKRLDKCPLCSGDMKLWRNVVEFRQDAECVKCGFEFSIYELDMIRADDADDPILEVVRRALEKQEAKV